MVSDFSLNGNSMIAEQGIWLYNGCIISLRGGCRYMRIAICDDDSQDLLQIALLVEAYRNSRKAHLVYISFESAPSFLPPWIRKIMTYCFWMF